MIHTLRTQVQQWFSVNRKKDRLISNGVLETIRGFGIVVETTCSGGSPASMTFRECRETRKAP